MRCDFCGGIVEQKKVTFIHEDNKDYLLVENVPAWVCSKCGERTYSPEVTDKILQFAKKAIKPNKIIEVPVLNYAEVRKQGLG